MSTRTRLIFWLTALPIVSLGVGAAWIAIYPFYLEIKDGGQSSAFIMFHLHFLRVYGVTMALFICGLISLLFERRMSGTK